MSEPELAARVKALERRCAGLVVAVALVGIATVVVVVGLAVRTPATLSAERFVLKDAGGAIRGEWAPSSAVTGSVDDKPTPMSTTCLTLRSPKRSRASLCAPWDEPGEPMVTLKDGTGSQATLIAGPLNAQLFLSSRANPDDQRPRNTAAVVASHAETTLVLRQDQQASRWTAAGAVAPSPPPAAR